MLAIQTLAATLALAGTACALPLGVSSPHLSEALLAKTAELEARAPYISWQDYVNCGPEGCGDDDLEQVDQAQAATPIATRDSSEDLLAPRGLLKDILARRDNYCSPGYRLVYGPTFGFCQKIEKHHVVDPAFLSR